MVSDLLIKHERYTITWMFCTSTAIVYNNNETFTTTFNDNLLYGGFLSVQIIHQAHLWALMILQYSHCFSESSFSKYMYYWYFYYAIQQQLDDS